MNASLLRLFQLVSPGLPVGGFAYSQGLEYAVHAGWIHDEISAQAWLRGQLQHGVSMLDAPIALRLYTAFASHDLDRAAYWNDWLYASRDAKQHLQQEQQTSRSLAKLLLELGVNSAQFWLDKPRLCFATTFMLAAYHFEVDRQNAVLGLLWNWLESMSLAVVKLIPLGQTAGQKMLLANAEIILACVKQAEQLSDADIGQVLPMISMAAVKHETLYSRLYRS